MSPSWSAPRLPKLRDQTVRHLADPQSPIRHGIAEGLRPTSAEAAEDGPMLDRIARQLGAADLYWVTPQMSALAVSSAQTLPEVRWSVLDQPSGFGLIVWDGGIGAVDLASLGMPVPAPVAAVSWGPAPGGMLIVLYVERGFLVERIEENGWGVDPGSMPPLIPVAHAVYEVGDWIQATELGTLRTAMTTLWATWSLMQTPTIVEHPHPRAEVDRDIRRSYGRAGKAVAEVSIVDLRKVYRPEPNRDREGGESGRETSYRFAVAAHWQDYWTGPGRAVRVKKLAAPYIGGTPGKPLRLDMEKVYVWRR